MKKKFFSLIHGDTVHVAPKTKIIPADEIATLQSAEEVVKSVKTDAEKYKKEVVAEIEKLKEQAQLEGFEAGYKVWMEHVAKLEAEIAKVRKDVEQVIMPISLAAAKKIVNKELEVSQNAIVDIISSSLKAVAQHKRVTIHVSQQEYETVEANRPKLKQLFENLEALSIRPRADVKPGGCVIETEAGIINAQLDNRWRILEAAFSSAAKPK